jgi:hypothetical protein
LPAISVLAGLFASTAGVVIGIVFELLFPGAPRGAKGNQ